MKTFLAFILNRQIDWTRLKASKPRRDFNYGRAILLTWLSAGLISGLVLLFKSWRLI